MKIADLSIRYSVLINMLVIAIVIMGVISMVRMPREEFPAVEFGRVIVVVVYPGASPQEMEELVTNKVETGLNNLPKLDSIESITEESSSTVIVSFETGVDSEEAYDLVTREMSKINDLPSEAMDPVIIRLSMRELNPISQLVVSGDFTPLALRELANELRDGILKLPDISKAELIGARDHQIWVDVDQARIDAYGLSLSDVSAVLQGRNLNIPGGTAKYGNTEFLVRALGQFNSMDEIGRMIITSDASGRSIVVNDIATVRDTLSKSQTIAKLNGQEGISVFLYKKGDSNIIKVMERVRKYITEFEASHPGAKISVRNDGSIDVKNGIGALSNSALMGILLVFGALLLFLGWRNAAFASTGIPLSLLITFIIVPLFGVTLNNFTIFALIIVVGMVVDNSIVVLENIQRHKEMGLDHRASIVSGVDQIISPVFASTLTTVAAFMPMLLTGGIMGQFLSVFPIVVSVALLASWFQSMVILPTNVYQFGRGISGGEDRTTRMIRPINRFYRKVITRALKHRGWVLGGTLLLLFISILVLFSGAIRFEFFPGSLSQTISLELYTPLGTSLEETNRVVSLVEQKILSLKHKDDIEFVVSNVGSLSSQGIRENKTSNAGLRIDLVPLKKMKSTHEEIKNEIREYLDTLPGLYNYKFSTSQAGPPLGKDVDIRIKGKDLERLVYISDVVKSSLKKIPGVKDIDDNNDPGKMEARIVMNQERLSMYGLSVAQVASAIRLASAGSEVTRFRGNGVDEIPIVVKLDDRYTQDFETLKDLKVRSRTGMLIPIRELADFDIGSSISRITHDNGDRVLSVTASVGEYYEGKTRKKRSTQEVVNILTGSKLRSTQGTLANFEQRFPGYTMEFGGVQKHQNESYSSLGIGFLIALLAIFTILASQFRSYVQPLIVMATIPLAFIGVVIGLLITRLSFSLNTMLSLVALAGVVVNNAILLIDFINQEREQGADRWHAIINSGSARLRPIILTTATTVAGMLPLVFSTDPSSQVWRPLAVTFAFGLSFATLITLFVIPVLYSAVDSFFGRLKMTRFKEHTKFEDAGVE